MSTEMKSLRECVRTGAAGAQTRRSLGHHLWHPQILRLLVLLKPTDFEDFEIQIPCPFISLVLAVFSGGQQLSCFALFQSLHDSIHYGFENN